MKIFTSLFSLLLISSLTFACPGPDGKKACTKGQKTETEATYKKTTENAGEKEVEVQQTEPVKPCTKSDKEKACTKDKKSCCKKEAASKCSKEKEKACSKKKKFTKPSEESEETK